VVVADLILVRRDYVLIHNSVKSEKANRALYRNVKLLLQVLVLTQGNFEFVHPFGQS